MNVPFTTNLRSIEDIEVSRLWTYTGRDDQQEELGEGDSVAIDFNFSGIHHLQFEAWDDGHSDEIVWDITVNSLIWSWIPVENNIIAAVDTTINFEVVPFNLESDSIECLWTHNDEEIGTGLTADLNFPDVGPHSVLVIVSEGAESDTVLWNVEINELNFVNNSSSDFPNISVLYPPSPNPFNSSARIAYALHQVSHLRIGVYDLAGREIAVLFDGTENSGKHSINWDADTAVAGIYFIKMEIEGFSSTRKVILMK